MKQFLYCMAMGCMLFSVSAKAQSLFTSISDNEAGLTTQQLTKLQTLRTNPAYESITMIQVGNFATLQHDGTVVVNVPGKLPRTAVAYAIENPSKSFDGDFKFEGSFFIDTSVGGIHDTTGDGEVTIYRKNGMYYGNISLPFDPDTYEIASFAPGKTALIKYDLHHTQNSHCGEAIDDGTPNTTQKITGGGCGSTVRVLVLFTTAAANAVVDIAGTAQHCIDDMNGTIINSLGSTQDLGYQLVAVQYLNYTENPSAQFTLDNFRANVDARNMRDNYAADLVILLTDGNFVDPVYTNYNIIGYSYSNGPDVEKAYSIVEADGANNNYVLNHEIGHDMGAKHQQSSVSITNYADNSPGYAHGYRMTRAALSQNTNYITMMHEDVGIKRSHVFSNPNYQIWHKDMGTLTDNYNAKTVLDNACTVAAFRPDTSKVFAAAIQPSSYLVIPGSNVHFTATTNNVGLPPYTYHWSVSNDGFTWTTLSSTASIADYTMPAKKRIYVMVDIYDVYGISALATNHVNGGIGNAFDPYHWTEPTGFQPGVGRLYHTLNQDDLEVYPNPARSILNVSYSSAANGISANSLKMFSVDGKLVYSGSFDPSHTSRQINVSTFANGLYYVELSTAEQTLVVKVELNR